MKGQKREVAASPLDDAARRRRASGALRGRALGFLLILRDLLVGAQELLPAPGDPKLGKAIRQINRVIKLMCPAKRTTKGGDDA